MEELSLQNLQFSRVLMFNSVWWYYWKIIYEGTQKHALTNLYASSWSYTSQTLQLYAFILNILYNFFVFSVAYFCTLFHVTKLGTQRLWPQALLGFRVRRHQWLESSSIPQRQSGFGHAHLCPQCHLSPEVCVHMWHYFFHVLFVGKGALTELWTCAYILDSLSHVLEILNWFY